MVLTHCGGHTIHSEGLWSPNTPHKWCTARSSPLELAPPKETDRERERERDREREREREREQGGDGEIISILVVIKLVI